MIKVAFFDIDGTLLDSQKRLPASTKKAITSLQEKNIHCVIATGRPPYRMEDVRKNLNIEDYVSLNGQYVVFDEQILRKSPLPQDAVLDIASIAAETDDAVAFCTQDYLISNADKHFEMKTTGFTTFVHKLPDKMKNFLRKQQLRFAKKTPIPTEKLMNQEVYQCVLHVSQEKLEKDYPMTKNLHVTRWNEAGVDICPLGGSKAEGIAAILNHLGVTKEEAIAFGDGFNDIEMLSYVGTGVAMGNAQDPVKQAADYVTTSSDEDGIYQALTKLKIIN